jgi:hypothetical protein
MAEHNSQAEYFEECIIDGVLSLASINHPTIFCKEQNTNLNQCVKQELIWVSKELKSGGS